MQKKGFSAVELLVAVGLASLFTIFVFRLFTQSGSSQRKATSDLNMQSKVLTSQNRILKMIREGTDFIIPAIGEESPALIFCDNESNINALYQLEDKKLSEKTGKKLYKLMHYKVDVKSFNLGSPAFDPKKSKVLAENVSDITFLISNANTVNVTACFSTESREFQTMFEVALLNTGETQ